LGCNTRQIPEFPGIGTTVGQQFSAALSGSSTVDAAARSRAIATEREMSAPATSSSLRLSLRNPPTSRKLLPSSPISDRTAPSSSFHRALIWKSGNRFFRKDHAQTRDEIMIRFN